MNDFNQQVSPLEAVRTFILLQEIMKNGFAFVEMLTAVRF
jgi:hypothetical protein